MPALQSADDLDRRSGGVIIKHVRAREALHGIKDRGDISVHGVQLRDDLDDALLAELLTCGRALLVHAVAEKQEPVAGLQGKLVQLLSLIHISEPTRLLSISYAVFCL